MTVMGFLRHLAIHPLVRRVTCNKPAQGVYVHVFGGIVLPNLDLIRSSTKPPSVRPEPDEIRGEGANQMATQTPTQRKATAQKAAATRRRNAAKRSASARKAAETRAQAELNTLQVVQAQAERALLIPVGAALTARDAVIEAYKPYVEGAESREKELKGLQKRVGTSLRKFERRGNTARNRAVREVKRTRTRVERELRQRRNKAVKTVKQNRRDVEKQVKSARREAEKQVETVVSRVASLA